MGVKKRCSKGHYYDAKYAFCPYCGDKDNIAGDDGKVKSRPFSGIRKKSISQQKNQPEDIHDVKTEYASNSNTLDNQKTEYLAKQVDMDDKKTEYLKEKHIDHESVDLDEMKTEYLSEKETDNASEAKDHGDMASLLSTRVPHNAVVGWLMCVNGEMTGEPLSIRRGPNSVIKDGQSHSIINEEVSGCQFEIIYDEKDRKYFITANDSSIGLNNRKISGKRSLYDGSLIQTEQSLFEFVAYCKGINKWQR